MRMHASAEEEAQCLRFASTPSVLLPRDKIKACIPTDDCAHACVLAVTYPHLAVKVHRKVHQYATVVVP